MSEAAIRSAFGDCHEDFAAARRIFVAFSGGLDSTVTLHVCIRLYSATHDIVAIHLHHGLQDEADAWLNHCSALAGSLGVEFKSEKLNVVNHGKGLEAAARGERYAAFERVLGADDLLLMGHHLDDQAETIMLRLLRGAGPDGLRGIPQRRTLGAGRLLRPLLSVPRSALRAYAGAESLTWIDDQSNESTHFDRNYLRAQVMPLLEAHWPGYRKTLSRAALQIGELVGEQADPTLATEFNCIGDPGFHIDSLPSDDLAGARALRNWLASLGLEAPSRAQTLECLRQLREGAGAQLQTTAWVLQRYRDRVYVFLPAPDFAPAQQSVTLGEEVDLLGAGRVVVDVPTEVSSSMRFALRFRRPQDLFMASNGRHRPLKKVFQELAIPPWWRERIPVVTAIGEQENELLLIGAFLRSPRAVQLGVEMHWQANTLKAK